MLDGGYFVPVGASEDDDKKFCSARIVIYYQLIAQMTYLYINSDKN
jgi:hypothetical protein